MTGELTTQSLPELEVEIAKEFSGFRIVQKADVWPMKVIGFLLRVLTFGKMTAFMDHFTTTIGYKVFVPNGWRDYTQQAKMIILRHERVHMRQAKAYGVLWFSFLYLFAFFPIGLAYFRAKFEKEAYAETLRAYNDYGYPLDDIRRQQIVNHFIGAEYAWMWPFPKSMNEWYAKTIKEIVSE